MKKTGLTLGKFLPFHLGHELLVQTAAACCDHLVILVGTDESDKYSFDDRLRWIASATEFSSCFVTVIEQKELDKDAPKDENGTITDEKYWSDWLSDTRKLLFDHGISHISHVFTSDAYGERIAKELGADWYPVDPDRSMIPVSGTLIRENFLSWSDFLPRYVLQDLTKVVAIVGPESTGKSFLTERLGRKYYGVPWCAEFGRAVCKPRGNTLTKKDFQVILEGQEAFICHAINRVKSYPLVLTDTEACVTANYYDMFFPEHKDTEFWDFAEKQEIDLYLVMAPNVPWVNPDGDRFMTEYQRWRFHYQLVEKLRKMNKNFKVIDSSDFVIRKAKAIQYIDELLNTL